MRELKRIVEDMTSVFSDSDYPREFLDEYDQMECLASGGGKETFLVRDKATGESAVAKCYDRLKYPFLPDFSLIRSLDCPGVPRFYRQYQHEGMLCVVREYVEGKSLFEYAGEKQLSLEEIVDIGLRLCDILYGLHSQRPPVIHRDIKPENIIVKPDGSLALIDFDISRVFKESEREDTFFFGTKGYAPPEQYGFGQTDSRTDIYAFGVLLRWLMTGSIKENQNVAIHPEMARTIEKCTAFSPENRYSDILEVRAALQRVKRKNRPRAGTLLSLAAAALLLLALGFAAGRYTDWLKVPGRVQFTEPLIETAVRLQLGQESGPLKAEQLEQVRQIFIYGTEAFSDPAEFYSRSLEDSKVGAIRTLDDLAMLPNLEEVRIVRQGNLDVNGLVGLAHLHTVELKHVRLSDIVPLSTLGRLREVVLFDAGLWDVTALENCPLLETLDVGLNNLTDLKRIGCHPNVRNLGLMWLKLSDVDDIAERMPKLKTVTLQHGTILDPSGLASLRELERVYVLEEQADAVRAALRDTGADVIVTEN